MEAIKITNLTKKFDNLTAVDNLSFEVKSGEIFGLLGPNGAGKTTTLSMLSTLLAPTSGEAIVNGFDVSVKRDDVRRSIGMIFQDPTLDDELTAEENLDFHGRLYSVPKEIRKKRIDELLKLVELIDRKKSLVKTFSGGMKRRLEIARGLLHEPKILFLDEPTIGLDPQTRNKLWEHIRELNKKHKMTIILTTHYMDEAEKLCDRVAIIDHGKIVALDTPENLINSLGGDMITISSDNQKKLFEELKKHDCCTNVKLHNHSVTINVSHAEKLIPRIMRVIDAAKIDIESITTNKPTLEDVFLYYTGRTIREQESTEMDNLRMNRRAWTRR
jgi:ABC-2 type transport system ATP-binding protein